MSLFLHNSRHGYCEALSSQLVSRYLKPFRKYQHLSKIIHLCTYVLDICIFYVFMTTVMGQGRGISFKIITKLEITRTREQGSRDNYCIRTMEDLKRAMHI